MQDFVFVSGFVFCLVFRLFVLCLYGEFDPGSGRTLAACLTHASRAMKFPSGNGLAADG